MSQPRQIQSTWSYPVSLRAICILFSHLHLWLPSGLFPSVCQPEICTNFCFPHKIYSTLTHSPWYNEPKSIYWNNLSWNFLYALLSRLPPPSSVLGTNIVPCTLHSNTFNLYHSLNVRNKSVHSHETTFSYHISVLCVYT